MKPVIHQDGLYDSERGADAEAATAILRLRQMEELIKQSAGTPPGGSDGLGRNMLTRTLDAGITAARRFAPPGRRDLRRCVIHLRLAAGVDRPVYDDGRTAVARSARSLCAS